MCRRLFGIESYAISQVAALLLIATLAVLLFRASSIRLWHTDLKGLKELKQLTSRYLTGTKVTAAGVKELKEALPKCVKSLPQSTVVVPGHCTTGLVPAIAFLPV
jgi:hypothetical protein